MSWPRYLHHLLNIWFSFQSFQFLYFALWVNLILLTLAGYPSAENWFINLFMFIIYIPLVGLTAARIECNLMKMAWQQFEVIFLALLSGCAVGVWMYQSIRLFLMQMQSISMTSSPSSSSSSPTLYSADLLFTSLILHIVWSVCMMLAFFVIILSADALPSFHRQIKTMMIGLVCFATFGLVSTVISGYRDACCCLYVRS
jgi:hypothetical protein